MTDRCEICRHSQPIHGEPYLCHVVKCKRHAPVLVIRNDNVQIAAWPQVDKLNVCGDFEEQPRYKS